MRPDSVNWARQRDELSVHILPRPRVRRLITRYVAVSVLVHAGLVALLLFLLQRPWMRDEPQSSTRVLSNTKQERTFSSVAADVFARGDVRVLRDGMIATAGGLCICMTVVIPILRRRTTRWAAALRQLHTGIQALAKGHEPKPVAIAGEDEFAYLGIAFNDMAGKLKASQHALIQANAELEDRVEQRTEQLCNTNAELDAKNKELAEVTETALRFTDDVAHDFRTPLAIILEFASLLADQVGGSVTEKQAEWLRIIDSATSDLALLVDDYLDSSKLRARTLRVDRRQHNVSDIIDAAWPILESRAQSASIQLHKDFHPDAPEVYADREKVCRALINLTTNAIKFSKSGSEVAIIVTPRTPNGAVISVKDSGPGMTDEEVRTLFERFRQTGEGLTSGSKGFGLGLCIVREMVALNFGTVFVESRVNQGSTFSFSLPPANARSLIEYFVEQAKIRSPHLSICALSVQREGMSDVELRAFLAPALHSGDLQLPDFNETHVLILGQTLEPDRWIRKLIRFDNSARERDETLAVPLSITLIGQWKCEDAAAALRELLVDDAQTISS